MLFASWACSLIVLWLTVVRILILFCYSLADRSVGLCCKRSVLKQIQDDYSMWQISSIWTNRAETMRAIKYMAYDYDLFIVWVEGVAWHHHSDLDMLIGVITLTSVLLEMISWPLISHLHFRDWSCNKLSDLRESKLIQICMHNHQKHSMNGIGDHQMQVICIETIIWTFKIQALVIFLLTCRADHALGIMR